ncbi:MAG: hypothetical protein HYR89_02575 [Actinobacteria bacterium]|nr:hypothetical protein [Actinomycetota bacterium]
MTSVAAFAALTAAGMLAALRWLRVAQREHYLSGSVSRFALRWWRLPVNGVLALGALASTSAMAAHPLFGLGAALAIAAGPRGLGLRGRSSPLTWTRRLKAVAATTLVLCLMVTALGAGLGSLVWAGAFTAIGMPVVIDAALALNAPIERRLAQRFIDQASRTLEAVHPVIVAITGSYGKTTIKSYVAHLLATSRRVVASPASFNNAAGLSRTVNEQLTPGTEVLVAEMGTYGKGEIRDLCSWVRPDIAVICAIGPVHLERMGSLDAIVEAKAEILEHAPIVVLNVDAFGLAAVADRCASLGKTVVRYCTTDQTVVIDGESIRTGDLGNAHPANVACALAVAKALGSSPQSLVERIGSLPVVAHRRAVTVAESGVTVIDDTFNANPAGAAAALSLLVTCGAVEGSKVVVTPGMVELGKLAYEENTRFARAAAARISHLVVVGQTNRRALVAGASTASGESGRSGPTVVTVATRDEAVAWVRANLTAGDAVLWENDLPDHFP